MPPSSTGRRPNRSDKGPITNWPAPKPIRKVDSTSWRWLALGMSKAAPILGSAGSIMSIASGFSAMMDAITMTNSGKPIGRCPEDTQSSALTSDKKLTSEIQRLYLISMLRCTTHVLGWVVGRGRTRIGEEAVLGGLWSIDEALVA